MKPEEEETWRRTIGIYVGCVLLILVVFLLLVALRWWTCGWSFSNNEMDFPRASINDVLQHCQTGDLVGVSFQDKLYGKIVRFFTGSAWSHIGLVYRPRPSSRSNNGFEPETAVVLEMYHYRDNGRSSRGAHKTPLRGWLAHHRQRPVLWKRRAVATSAEDEAHLIRVFDEQVRDKALNQNLFTWLEAWWGRKQHGNNKTAKKTRLFCSELVAHLMQQVGWLPKEMTPASYSPRTLLFPKDARLCSQFLEPGQVVK